MKWYYGTLFLIWLLSSCTPTPNVSERRTIGMDDNGIVCEQTVNKHTYVIMQGGIAHSGECKQCKHELDSIIRKAIREEVGK